MENSLFARSARMGVVIPFALLAAGAIGCGSSPTNSNNVATIDVTPAMDTLLVGDSAQLTATAKASNGSTVQNVTFTWASDTAGVVSVSSSGQIKALTAGGPVHISATHGNITGLATVVDTSVTVASVVVAPLTVNVAVGGTTQLSDTVKDVGGNPIGSAVSAWSSADTSKAKVSSTGLVTGVAAGGPIAVTATSGGKMGSSQVTVLATP